MAKRTKLAMTGGLIDCPKCRSIVHELMDDDGFTGRARQD